MSMVYLLLFNFIEQEWSFTIIYLWSLKAGEGIDSFSLSTMGRPSQERELLFQSESWAAEWGRRAFYCRPHHISLHLHSPRAHTHHSQRDEREGGSLFQTWQNINPLLMNVGLPIAPVNTYYCIMRPSSSSSSSSRNATRRLLLPTNKRATAAGAQHHQGGRANPLSVLYACGSYQNLCPLN